MSQPQTATNEGGESFASLFEESLTRSEMRMGEVITAEVVRVEHSFVVVNAGLKSEAYVPIEEFKNDHGGHEAERRALRSDARERVRTIGGERRGGGDPHQGQRPDQIHGNQREEHVTSLG